MDKNNAGLMLGLVRAAMGCGSLSEEQRGCIDEHSAAQLLRAAQRHELGHLAALGLSREYPGLCGSAVRGEIGKAIFRFEQQRADLAELCGALEAAGIDFMPLKGSVLREYYPEPWLRSSCDIDVLVHPRDADKAVRCLSDTLKYRAAERGTHDISLHTPAGTHVELHYDLMEEQRANSASRVLTEVWEHAAPAEGSSHRYEMEDSFFYFYHIAHMAKHFEHGGCGVRPFIDLWILDGLSDADTEGRAALLQRGDLHEFAQSVRRMSRVWMTGDEPDGLCHEIEEYILNGGVYGTAENRVAISRGRKGSRGKYLLSRLIVPYDTLRRYYPVLEKHRWLTPLMQVRRWFMLLRPSVARRAKREIALSRTEAGRAEELNSFLRDVGLK